MNYRREIMKISTMVAFEGGSITKLELQGRFYPYKIIL